MAELWKEDWTGIVLRHGLDSLEEALQRHRRSSSFLPSLHDVETYVQAIVRERRERRILLETQELLEREAKERAAWEAQPDEDKFTMADIFREVMEKRRAKLEAAGLPVKETNTLPSEVLDEI